jgi:hypothetical protein
MIIVLWGAGPLFRLPTATDDRQGSDVCDMPIDTENRFAEPLTGRKYPELIGACIELFEFQNLPSNAKILQIFIESGEYVFLPLSRQSACSGGTP